MTTGCMSAVRVVLAARRSATAYCTAAAAGGGGVWQRRYFSSDDKMTQELGPLHRLRDIPVLTGNPRPVTREDEWRCAYKLTDTMEYVLRDLLKRHGWSDTEIEREVDNMLSANATKQTASFAAVTQDITPGSWSTVEDFQRTPWYRRYRPPNTTVARYVSYEALQLLEQALVPPSLRRDPYAHLRKRHFEDSYMHEAYSEQSARYITRDALAHHTKGMPSYNTVTRRGYLEFVQRYRAQGGSVAHANEAYHAWLRSLKENVNTVAMGWLVAAQVSGGDEERGTVCRDDATHALQIRNRAERRVKEWRNYQRSHRSYDEQNISRGFVDLCFGGAVTRRLVIDLHDKDVPHTVSRFRDLLSGTCRCAADGATADVIDMDVYYIDTNRSFACIGNADGDDISIPVMRDERACVRQIVRGDVVMLSTAPNATRSSFAIILKSDARDVLQHAIVGTISDGIDTLDLLERLPLGEDGRPLTRVCVTLAGVLTGARPMT